MRPRILILGVLSIPLAGLLACEADDPFIQQTFGFTFETGLVQWEPDGTDLEDPPVEWSIEISDSIANEREQSVRLHLENFNDAGKIWMERAITLLPRSTYDVTLAFDFASADFGDVNLWTLIAGATNENPEVADDLVFQSDTGNGAGSDQGFVWERKEFRFTVDTGSDGQVWLAIGVWGTSEFTRTYFVDDVAVTATFQ